MNDCRHPPANKANRRALHSNDNWQRSDSSFLRRYDRRYAGAEFCAGLALMVASGCHAWRARPVTAPDPSTATRTLRLTTNQGARRLTLERATVRSDSVVGRLCRCRRPERRPVGARQHDSEGGARSGRSRGHRLAGGADRNRDAHGPAPWAPCSAGLCRGVLRRRGAEKPVRCWLFGVTPWSPGNYGTG